MSDKLLKIFAVNCGKKGHTILNRINLFVNHLGSHWVSNGLVQQNSFSQNT